jgi:hypothetical protein
MAQVGVCLCALFLLLVLAGAVLSLLVPPCAT